MSGSRRAASADGDPTGAREPVPAVPGPIAHDDWAEQDLLTVVDAVDRLESELVRWRGELAELEVTCRDGDSGLERARHRLALLEERVAGMSRRRSRLDG